MIRPRCHTIDPFPFTPFHSQVPTSHLNAFPPRTYGSPQRHQLTPQTRASSKIPLVHVAHVVHGSSQVWTRSLSRRTITIHRIIQGLVVRSLVSLLYQTLTLHSTTTLNLFTSALCHRKSTYLYLTCIHSSSLGPVKGRQNGLTFLFSFRLCAFASSFLRWLPFTRSRVFVGTLPSFSHYLPFGLTC